MKDSIKKIISVQYFSSRIFKRFILSYVTIIIPLLLTGAFMHNNLLKSLLDETINSTINNIIQTRDIVDLQLQSLNYIAVQFPENKNIAPLIYSRNVSNLSEYQFYLLVRELKNYRASNAFLENIFVYFRNSDIIVGAEGKYTLDIFYNNVYRYSTMSQSDFKHMLNTVNDYTYRAVEKIYNFNYYKKIIYKEIITYLIPVPITGDKHNATLIITIDGSSINQILENSVDLYKGVVYIFDEKNNIISKVGDKNFEIGNEKVAKFLGDYGTNVVKQEVINGQKHIILSTKSSKTGWGYVAILPRDRVLAKVNNIRKWAICMVGLSTVVALLLAYYFSFTNYYPINKTANSLLIFNKEDSKASRDEFEMIERSLHQIISKNETMEKRIKSQLSVVRSDFIKKLLRGEYTDNDSIESMVRFVEIEPFVGPFSVIIFNIDDYEEFKEHSKVTQNAYRFAIINLVEELSQNIGRGYAIGEEDNIALLIDFRGKDMEYNEGMIALCQKTLEFFEKNFDFTLTAGIGGIYELLTDISKSFVEATLAIDYKIVKGKNSVIVYQEMAAQKHEALGYYYSIQSEEKILSCLDIGDFEGINKVLISTIENIKKKHIDINVARCLYFEIVSTAMKVLEKLDPEDYCEIVLEGNVLPDMVKCETLDDLYCKIAQFYKTICERIKLKKEREDNKLGDMIIRYVNENYCDNNLTLTVLSEKFGVTSAYLSRFFKSRTKYNFVEYLHRLRLKKAKRLLLETDESISDIAIRCGYLDSHGLIRAFKRYENITPGKFRENMKKGSNLRIV